MQRREFRRIEEAARTLEAERDEVSQPGATVADRCILADRAKRSESCTETAGRFLLIQTRFRNHVYDETGLVAVLSGGGAGNYLQCLDRIGRKLRGKHFALLV